MKKLIQLSATPALVAGMAALSAGGAEAQSFFDEVNTYIGVTGGYGSGKAKHHDANDESYTTKPDYGIISILAGIDTRQDDWLIGIEGDIGLPVGGFSHDDDEPDEVQWSDMNYNAHVRARVGRSIGDVDVFIAAGLAVAELDVESDFLDGDDTTTLVGLSIGAGADVAFSDQLKARVEILHDDYGRETTVFGNYNGDWSDVTVRGGLLFQF